MQQKLNIRSLSKVPSKSTKINTMETSEDIEHIENTIDNNSLIDIALDTMNVDPVVIDKIDDTMGRIRDFIRAIEKETGYTSFPFNVIHINPNILSIKDHEIIHLRGIKYCVSQEIRQDVIEIYKNLIINKISAGMPFVEDIWTVGTYKGIKFNTLKLNFKELGVLVSMFVNYGAKCSKNSDDTQLLLQVNGYI